MTKPVITEACDGLLFDMDGTLWDAVDSYVKIWNKTIADAGVVRQPVTRQELISLMGKQLDVILATLLPGPEGHSPGVQKLLAVNDAAMMPVLGGRLYEGVTDTLRQLHGHIPLYMVSNCGEQGLENFLTFTGLRPYFTDWLSHGATKKPKSANIAALVERYNMKHPMYVGDTATDADASAKAGVPMIWCRYGFGTVDKPDFVIDSITELAGLPPVADALK